VSDVIALYDLRVVGADGDRLCTVEAVVADMAVVIPASREEPEEYGPALCRGSFDLSDDEVIPVDEQSQAEFVADRVTDWQFVDASDY
jgi:hypothetical protein